MLGDEEARFALARLIKERGSDCAGLSRLIGRNPAYVQQYIMRGSPRRLAEDDRRKLARFFGVGEELLGGPNGTEMPPLVPVARLDVRAAAGDGALEGDERGQAHIAFDPLWLKRVARGRPEDLSIIRVAGDSMLPTLGDGDDILVDRGDAGGRLRDGVYALRLDGGLVVKRLRVDRPAGLVEVISDNVNYPRRPPEPAAIFDLVGRVVWTGRRIA